MLKQAGYRTGGIGKYSLGDPGSWGVPSRQGFDYYYGQLNQDQAHFYYPHYLWENYKVELLSGNRAEQKQEYTHDLYTEKALAFIGENKEDHEYLYWDYGHVRKRYMQAVRYGNYKGIRSITEWD